MFFSIVGPGLITANADNDVGGILTYSQAGAQFGYSLLWMLIPVTLALIVVQEMCARMGAVTGKVWPISFARISASKSRSGACSSSCSATSATPRRSLPALLSSAPIFAGYLHLANAEAFKIALVAGAALFVFFTVTRGTAKVVERIFFAFCFVYIAYIVSAFVVRPDWSDVLHQSIVPHWQASKAYLIMIIAVIGTTISPWMQFYIQAAVVDKGVREEEYGYSRLDVVTGGIWTDVIAYFIIVSCAATIFVHNLHAAHPTVVNDVGDVAIALQPIAGRFAALLFALGLLNAAVFTASILPLSTAYYVCEAFGFERGIDHRVREAPVFYGFYLALIIIGAGVVILPGAPLPGDHLLLAGAQRRAAAGRARPHAAAHQQQAAHGRLDQRRILNVVAWATVGIVGFADDRLHARSHISLAGKLGAHSVSGARSAPITSAVLVPGLIAVAKVRESELAAGVVPITTLLFFTFESMNVGTFHPAPRNAPTIVPSKFGLPVALATSTSSCGGSARSNSTVPISFAQRWSAKTTDASPTHPAFDGSVNERTFSGGTSR